MNALIESVIAKVLSPYLEGVSRDNLRLGLLSGSLNLTRLQVKPSILSELHLYQASLEEAVVDSVSVTIPWMNPLNGKVVIQVKGVCIRVRLSEPRALDKDKLIAIKRDIIDRLKSSVPTAPSLLAQLKPDSLTAKLVRRVIDAIVIDIRDIDLSISSSNGEVDDEGFQDASEADDVQITVAEIGVSDQPSPGGDCLEKSLKIGGVSVQVASACVIPDMDLNLVLRHEMTNKSIHVSITGLDNCEISLTRTQLVLMNKTVQLLTSSPESLLTVSPVEMSADAKAAYVAAYRKLINMESEFWTEARHRAKFEVDEMALLFDPKLIAECEALIDAEHASRARDATTKEREDWVESVKARIPEIEPPSSLQVHVEIGRNWKVQLPSIEVNMGGSVIDFELSTDETQKIFSKIYFASRGLSIFHKGESVLQFNTRSSGASRTSFSSHVIGDAKSIPVEVSALFSKESSGSAEFGLKVRSDPLRLTYQAGFLKDIHSLVTIFTSVSSCSQDQWLTSSQQMLNRLQSSAEFQELSAAILPKTVEIELDIAGPLIVIPTSCPGEHIMVSLGNLNVSQPKTVLDFSMASESLPASAVLDQVSLSVVSASESTMQLLSPSPIEITGNLHGLTKMIHISVAMVDGMSCRVSPESVQAILRLVEFIQSELPTTAITSVSSLPPDRENTQSTMEEEDFNAGTKYSFVQGLGLLVDCKWKRIDLRISDGCSDVINVLVAIPDMSLGYSFDSGDLALSVDRFRMTMRCLNSEIGVWEPLIEPTSFSMFGHSAGNNLNLSLKSEGTNFVLTPSSIAVLLRLAKSSLAEAPSATKGGGQYRLVNATSRLVYLAFPMRKRSLIELVPSDGFFSLDESVLRFGAREILLSFEREDLLASLPRTEDSPLASSVVRVALDGVVEARLDSSFLVHSMRPDRHSSFQTLLISRETFIINQCDIPMELTLPTDLPTPSAELVGAIVFRGTTVCLDRRNFSASLLLNPGTFVSVQGDLLPDLQIRPVTGGDRPWAFLKQADLGGVDLETAGGLHVRVEKQTWKDSIVHIHLRPPLLVTNNLPIPIKLKHTLTATESRQVYVTVPEWESVAIYSCPASDDFKSFSAALAFINPESEWSGEISGQSEERHLLSPEIGSVCAVHLTSVVGFSRQLTVSAKWWLVDRTGLKNLVIFNAETGIPFPKTDSVWLLPDPDVATTVEVAYGRCRWEQGLLDGGWVAGFLGPVAVVLNSKETLRDKYVELVPRFTVFNALSSDAIFVSNKFTGGGTWNSFDLVEPGTGIPLLHSKDSVFKFQLADGSTSCEIPLRDACAGIWPVCIGKRICRVEISPVEGCIHVTVRDGSTITVTNQKRRRTVYIDSDDGNIFAVGPSTTREIGWRDPFKNATVSTNMKIGQDGQSFLIPLARASEGITYGGCVRVVASEEPQSIKIVVERSVTVDAEEGESPMMNVTFDLEVDKVGFSLARAGMELMYTELSLIRAKATQSRESLKLAVLVSEIQIETCCSKNNEKPVIVANTGEGSRPFMEAVVDLATNVSKGVAAVSQVHVQFDSLFVEVDSDLAAALDDCLKDLVGSESEEDPRSCRTKKLLQQELVAIQRGTVVPVEVPNILILDSMYVSRIDIELWVDFALKSMLFMPASLKLIVGMLSLGKSFKLEAAKVVIRPRAVDSFKGSADQFFQSLFRDYTVESMRNAASLLGNSSLLAIPRAPISFVSGVGSKGLEKAAGAVSGVLAMVSDLTADAKYREQQQRIRRSKKIAGFADGFIEGANRIGEGLGGMLDIFKKPVEGAKRGGVSGFMKGIGRGLVGSVVKPIAKLGESFGDVGTGIAKSFSPKKHSSKSVFARRRIPRPFYGKDRAVADYRSLDALLSVVEMELVVSLFDDGGVLMAFPDHVVLLRSGGVEEDLKLAEVSSAIPVVPSSSVIIETVHGQRIEVHISESTPSFLVALANALGSGPRVDWREIRKLQSDLFLEVDVADSVGRAPGPSHVSTVETWEVERYLMAYGWITPFMMLDVDTSWRWLDDNMRKHPRIDGRFSRKDSALSKIPPLTFGELWRPTSDWQIVTDSETTDANGWMYAISFNSSTWQNSPGITASVRRRKWTRSIT